jgi:predicted alpha/beta-fold hydrolase
MPALAATADPLPPPALAAFTPGRWLGNGHVMTIAAWASKRDLSGLPSPEARLFRVSDETQVLAHCYWQPDRAHAPALVALHGLEGSSAVHYMRGMAWQAWRRGWNAVLLNQRNCGGTEHLTPSLYHSGLTADPREVIRQIVETDGIRDVGVVGYSLGGNLTVRLAGELGDSSRLPVRAVAAICPTIDLDRCVRAIERRSNVAYQFNFVRNLKSRMRRKAAAWPGRFDLAPLSRIWTIRAFDDAYTAPHHGFGDAANYYFQASALRLVDRIRVPALMLSAADDPFVPSAQFAAETIRGNPAITVSIPAHGGHCAFLSNASGDERYWAETTAVDFLARVMPPGRRGSSDSR